MARKKQSKIGRPPKRKGERLSKNRTFRVRGTLDEQLEAAAQTTGRSVSEEIEHRLEESFRRDERADLMLQVMDHTLKVLGISTDVGTWSPDLRAWAANQPGLLGLFASEQPATDKKEELK
jgi:hypothetical protein